MSGQISLRSDDPDGEGDRGAMRAVHVAVDTCEGGDGVDDAARARDLELALRALDEDADELEEVGGNRALEVGLSVLKQRDEEARDVLLALELRRAWGVRA